MKIKDYMTRSVRYIDPDTTIRYAAAEMRHYNVGILPVCEQGRVIGILTDRDIVTRVCANELDVNETMVRDVMTPGVVSCREEQDVESIARTMKSRQIRRVPVLDAEGLLTGIISVTDVARAEQHRSLVASVLNAVGLRKRGTAAGVK